MSLFHSSVERVFGCHIATLCEREKTTVPSFIAMCIESIEKKGEQNFHLILLSLCFVWLFVCLSVCLFVCLFVVCLFVCQINLVICVLAFFVSGLTYDGMYRVCGNACTVQRIRIMVDQGMSWFLSVSGLVCSYAFKISLFLYIAYSKLDKQNKVIIAHLNCYTKKHFVSFELPSHVGSCAPLFFYQFTILVPRAFSLPGGRGREKALGTRMPIHVFVYI